MGNPGESADQHAKRLSHEAGAWAAGAEGERRVAASLASLPAGWTVVHDRLLRPGRSEANLDHVVIGPTGVYLVDAKNRAGRVTEHEGGLFQHIRRDGWTETVSLAAELKKVHGMAAYMAAECDGPVTPVLCLAGSRAEEFGEPRMVRGVWVVPVAALPGWLRARPVAIATEGVPRVATRVITDFPSTTTDPDLLASMDAAALARTSGPRRQRLRGTSMPSTSRSSTQRTGRPTAPKARASAWRRVGRGLGRLAVGVLLIVLLFAMLAYLPGILTAGVTRLAGSSGSAGGAAPGLSSAPATTAAATPAQRKAATSPPAKRVTTSDPKLLGPPDCANASAAEVGAIIGRTVKPVFTSSGCLWGTRLDDGSTALVSISLRAGHSDFDSVMNASVKQKRAVFGSDYTSVRGIGTRVSIATGQPITRAARARADTVVVVAGGALGVSDDRARQMAVAIAVKANG